MPKTLLIDTFTFTPIQALEEAVMNGRKALVYEGRVQFADKPNQNNRVYPRKLWERVLNDPKVLESLQEKRMLGTLDHPADGKTTLENASHVITGLQIKEDGEIIGKIQILNTPKGQVLKALCEDGIPWGASSRGNGSLKDGPNGVKYVQDDFQFETIDAVYNPSTFGAYPQQVTESVETNKELMEEEMNFADKFNELEQRTSKALSVKAKAFDENTKGLVRKEITSVMVEASKLGQEAPEYRSLTESIIAKLDNKRTLLTEEGEVGSPAEQGITQLVNDNADGQADQGFIRRVPVAPLPPPGDGGHVVDPVGVAVPSPAEQALLALVNEEFEKDEEGEEDDEETKKKKKKKKGDGDDEEPDNDEDDKKMESYAMNIAKNSKLPKSSRALAASYIFESKRRINEAEAYKRIIGKMQEKLDDAIKTGKVVVESDETLAAKYQLSQDVLREVVRRYHIQETTHYAVNRLIETGLDKNDKARKFINEAIKASPEVNNQTIDEAILLFSKVSGFDLSKEPRPKSEIPVPVIENKEPVKNNLTEARIPAAAVKELPLKDLSGKIASLNETAPAKSEGVRLANRLTESLAISRPRPTAPVKLK
jgi:hypothetical protein